MQTLTITLEGDGDVRLVRTRVLDDAEALPTFIAVGKVLGDEPSRRRGRRPATSSSDDTTTSPTNPEAEG